MGEVIDQLHKELRGARLRFQYNLVKGGVSGLWGAVRAFFSMLWRRPVALVAFLATLLFWRISGSLLTGLFVTGVLMVLTICGLWIAILLQLDGSQEPDDSSVARVVVGARRSIQSRRVALLFKKDWPNTVQDLGLTTTIQRKGTTHVLVPKIISVEERR